MKKTIFSLALGTFGLGMAEFGIMGVLTDAGMLNLIAEKIFKLIDKMSDSAKQKILDKIK